MSQLVPAATQLIQQIAARGKVMSVNIADGPDGFGRHRAIRFDANTSEWLVPILGIIDDPRIDHINHDDGQAIVTFVADTRADFHHRYPIEEVDRVLNG